MTALAILEGLVAGVWLGSLLFTTYVVSPALAERFPHAAERTLVRSTIGRRFGRLALPLLLAWMVLVMAQGLTTWNVSRLVLIAVVSAASGLHGAVLGSRMNELAQRELDGGGVAVARERVALQQRSARVTPVLLVLSGLLAVLAVV